MSSAWVDYIEVESLRRSMAWARRELDVVKRELQERKAGFDANQPRVPAGNPDGGQWTRVGSGFGSRYADAGGFSDPLVMSDANPEPLIPGAQYAQTQITIHPSALQGISRIDDVTIELTNTLARVMDTAEFVPNMAPGVYGTLVHTMFAAEVRAKSIAGIGYDDVETTFGIEEDAPYGAKFSIRTDVILRNEVGDIVAIYDVKTGGAKLTPKRVREIRERTGAADNVPIIEMHVLRGVTRKGIAKSDHYFWIVFVRLWTSSVPDMPD
jgi:hypothetical protein